MRNKAVVFLVLFAFLGVLTLWSGGQQDSVEAKGKISVMVIRLTEEAVAKFEEEFPGIKLEVQVRPFPDIFNHIEVAMQAESADPDVVPIDAPLVYPYAYKGWLEPLDEWIPRDLVDQHAQIEVDSGTYNGQLVAAPHQISIDLCIYNKDMFEEAGLALPPQVPESMTWEELVPAAQKLVKKDAAGNVVTWGFIIEQPDMPYEVGNMIQSLGGKCIGDDEFTVRGVIDTEPWRKALQFYGDIYNKWNLAPTENPWAPIMLMEQKTAMITAGPWGCPTWSNAETIDFEMGTTAYPHFEGGKVVNNCGGWHWGINSNSRNKKAAAEFLKWQMRPDINYWLWETGYADIGMTSVKSMLEKVRTDPKYSDYPEKLRRDYAMVAGHDELPRARTPGWLEYRTIFITEAGNVRMGQKEVDQALEDMITDMENEFKKYQ